MAQTELIKNLVRPPFANYDIVVYFGCGLFALPFLMHYLGQHEIHFLDLDVQMSPEFVGTFVTTLVLLFSVYILGHIIAYVGSQVIEKTMDSFFGKVSTVILLCSACERGAVNSIFRRQLKLGMEKSLTTSAWFSGVIRLLAHFPVLLIYAGVIVFGVFGFYRSRVSGPVVEAAQIRYRALGLSSSVQIAEGSAWYKPLEAYVMNNHPTATARMYNYLVISGLFRSVCIILLGALWFEMVYLLDRAFTGTSHPGILMLGNDSFLGQLFSYGAVALVYVFCLFSYLKFQRRYVEEAVFAFVFAKD